MSSAEELQRLAPGDFVTAGFNKIQARKLAAIGSGSGDGGSVSSSGSGGSNGSKKSAPGGKKRGKKALVPGGFNGRPSPEKLQIEKQQGSGRSGPRISTDAFDPTKKAHTVKGREALYEATMRDSSSLTAAAQVGGAKAAQVMAPRTPPFSFPGETQKQGFSPFRRQPPAPLPHNWLLSRPSTCGSTPTS